MDIIHKTRKYEKDARAEQSISLTSIEKHLKPEIIFPLFFCSGRMQRGLIFFKVFDAKLGWSKTVIIRNNYALMQISSEVNQNL